MKRRQFFEKLGLGSAAALASAPVLAGTLAASPDDHEHQHEAGHDRRPCERHPVQRDGQLWRVAE